jgi:hypothetical protein
MKTYTLEFYIADMDAWYRVNIPPDYFTTLEEAQTELAVRTFRNGHQYRVVEVQK